MKTQAALSFVIRDPRTDDDASLPTLLFLHGLGEAATDKSGAAAGLRALFNHSVPRTMYDAAPRLDELSSFVIIAPQLAKRTDEWTSVAGRIRAVVDRFRSPGEPLYLVGFSKGGLAAFQLAPLLGAHAIVTIDASSMNNPTAMDAVLAYQGPFWAICTDHAGDPGYVERITCFHADIARTPAATIHGGIASAPLVNSRAVTTIALSDVPAGVARHGAVAATVAQETTPWAFLLAHI
jgi:hypothetical protein